jgi:hypothetical protein
MIRPDPTKSHATSSDKKSTSDSAPAGTSSSRIKRANQDQAISHQDLHRSDHPAAASNWTMSRQDHQIVTTTLPQSQIRLVLGTRGQYWKVNSSNYLCTAIKEKTNQQRTKILTRTRLFKISNKSETVCTGELPKLHGQLEEKYFD